MASWISMLLFVILLIGLFSFAFLKHRVFKGKYEKKAFKLPPGPRGLPILGNLHMLGDLPHRNLHQLAKKYGPVMYLKLGLVPTIVISSSESAKLFLKSHDKAFSNRPKMQAAKYINYGQKGLVFGEYGSYWRNIRKICTLELLTNSKIELFKPIRREELRNLVKGLKDAADAGDVVDLSAKVEELIEDISYRMIFGSKDDRFNFKPCIQESVKLFGAFNLSDFVPFLGVLDLQDLHGKTIYIYSKSKKDTPGSFWGS